MNENSTFLAHTHIYPHRPRARIRKPSISEFQRSRITAEGTAVPCPWYRGIDQGMPIRTIGGPCRSLVRSLVDVDQPDGAVQARRRRRRVVHGDDLVQGRRLPQQLHATLVSHRTVLLRGRPRWLTVGRRRWWGRRLRMHLVG